ncbi:class I SAM-dependent methyltransferase [Streptomyces sp. TRM49041]|uniref:class I SAM-dependent methyltransferase n=1 Tax=Streptomyces sp. TRM49041 TaxID=2603216 RepID=UPI0016568D5D|nr:class I SAM-dependent methyltransferase [Streptomyces sp. TRM49041]
MDEQEWRCFIAAYHRSRAGITERFLALADASPYAWLTEPLRGVDGPVVDLACGSAPTRAELPDADWIGVDLSAAELAEAARRGRGPLVRASVDDLPLASDSAAAVCAAMCLPVVTPLPRVLAEVRRVLRPGGTLAALVPSASGLSPAGLAAWARVMLTLRVARQRWPNPQARDGAAEVLGTAGFRVRSDEHRVFTLTLPSPESAALLVDALYLPSLTPRRAESAKRSLARWIGQGRRIELPLRRVLAELPSDRTDRTHRSHHADRTDHLPQERP